MSIVGETHTAIRNEELDHIEEGEDKDNGNLSETKSSENDTITEDPNENYPSSSITPIEPNSSSTNISNNEPGLSSTENVPTEITEAEDLEENRRSSDNISTASSKRCRICLEESDEPYIDLGCECRGDIALVHESCLKSFMERRSSHRCDVCRTPMTKISFPICPRGARILLWILLFLVTGWISVSLVLNFAL